MFAEEWPLMMFTLISQLAIGSFMMLAIARALLSKQDASMAEKLTNPGFKAVVGLMLLALVFSLFHLGTPTGAYRSILNLGTSWLSREILTAGGFLAFSFLSYNAYKKGKPNSVLTGLTALLGLAAIFCMVNIYSHSIRPAWTNINTYVAFFGATFALGSLGASALIGYGAKGLSLTPGVLTQIKKVGLVGAVAVILPLIYLPVFISGLESGNTAAQASAHLLTGMYIFPLILRGLISLAGVGFLYFSVKDTQKTIPLNRVYLALALVVIGEFIGRYVFYGSALSIMIGLN